MQRGNNPPESCRTQVFKVPAPGFDPRGVDIDTNGVVWTALAASSHLASFDVPQVQGPERARRRPTAASARKAGRCIRPTGPKLKGTDIPADFHYSNWVDQQNVSASGKNTRSPPARIPTRCSPSNPQTKKWTTLRVPYPLGFYSRGMDGRIDDPNGGLEGPRRSRRTTAPTSCGTSKGARGPRARSSTSSSARIRSRDKAKFKVERSKYKVGREPQQRSRPFSRTGNPRSSRTRHETTPALTSPPRPCVCATEAFTRDASDSGAGSRCARGAIRSPPGSPPAHRVDESHNELQLHRGSNPAGSQNVLAT